MRPEAPRTRASLRPSRRLDYEPAAFPGVLSPPGPSPKAIAALKEQGMWTEVVPVPTAAVAVVAPTQEPARTAAEPSPVARPAKIEPAPVAQTPMARPLPPAPAARLPEPVVAAPSAVKPPATPRVPTTPRPAPAPRARPSPKAPDVDAEARIARTIRLAPNVDAQIQAIAARFGVDLTAAVAIAVTHGYATLAAGGFVTPVER